MKWLYQPEKMNLCSYLMLISQQFCNTSVKIRLQQANSIYNNNNNNNSNNNNTIQKSQNFGVAKITHCASYFDVIHFTRDSMHTQ